MVLSNGVCPGVNLLTIVDIFKSYAPNATEEQREVLGDIRYVPNADWYSKLKEESLQLYGTYDKKEIPALRSRLFEELYLKSCDIMVMSEYEFIAFLMLLSLFLYVESVPCGKLKRGVYSVYKDTVKEYHTGSGYEDIAYNIVQVRNDFCHYFGSIEEREAFSDLYCNRHDVLDFCEYFGLYRKQ